jgi:hypothetical protein
MATNAPRTQQDAAAKPAPHGAITSDAGVRRLDPSAPGDNGARKPVGYGLPCSKCRLYYPADLDICPACNHNERMAPIVPQIPPKVAQAVVEPIPDTAAVEQEREEFLRQFKSQLLEAHAEVAIGSESPCALAEQHTGEPAPAEICRACYERLQERLDVCEAALHLDLKEAAQIIYDAVWADPSDPSKTYQNAATALLAELRKRAGMNSLMGPFQSLSH